MPPREERTPSVLAGAAYSTLGNDEDGVAVVLEQLVQEVG